MFSKPANANSRKTLEAAPSPAPTDPTPRRAPKAASLIGDNLVIEGGISGGGEVHIDGTVRGEVRVERLTIGETGHVEGAIFAEVVEARGRVVGSISAKQVRLFGAAHIEGDITHEQLAIESGAYFEGRSLRFQRQAANAEPLSQTVTVLEPKLAASS